MIAARLLENAALVEGALAAYKAEQDVDFAEELEADGAGKGDLSRGQCAGAGG